MSWIEGITDLCTLSATCKLNWNAWAAIGGIAAAAGTFVAAMVALVIFWLQTRHAREGRREQARGILLLLFEPLREWRNNLRKLARNFDADDRIAVMEAIEEDGDDVLRVPTQVQEHLVRIGELGEVGLRISRAVHRARRAKTRERSLHNAFRGDFIAGEERAIRRAFRADVITVLQEVTIVVSAIDRDLGEKIFERSHRSRWLDLLDLFIRRRSPRARRP